MGDDGKATKQVPGSTTYTPVNKRYLPIQFYFFVTGRTGNNGFGGFGDHLAVEILAKLIKGKAPGTARFIHFDCWKNQVGVADFTPTKMTSAKKPTWVPIKDFKPDVGDNSQDPKTFVDVHGGDFVLAETDERTKKVRTVTLTDQLTITNVYHSIRGAPKESVVAVMFISHGFDEGPVLLDTAISETGLPLVEMRSASGTKVPAWDSFSNLPKRWEKDADGRMDSDFADNMGEDPAVGGSNFAVDGTTKLKDGGKDALSQFKSAFNKSVVPGLGFAARIGLLGCDVQEIVYNKDNQRLMLESTVKEVLEAIMWGWSDQTRGYVVSEDGKKVHDRTITDEHSVSFDLREKFDDEAKEGIHFSVSDPAVVKAIHFGSHADFFGSPPPSGTQVCSKWGEVVKFAARETVKTYAFKAAKTLNVEVLATPPGTSGEIEKETPNKMVACGKNSRCQAIAKFFNDFVGLRKGEDGYSLFDATSVPNIEQHAAP